MTSLSKISIALAVFAGLAATAQAETVQNPSWYIMPSIGVSKPDNRFNDGHNAPGVGLRFGKQVSPSWDLQLGGTYSRDHGRTPRYEQGTLGVDGLYMLSRGAVRPFVLVGAGAQRDRIGGSNETSPYISAGFGVQAAVTERLFVQADVRRSAAHLRGTTFNADHSITDSANVGLAYYFDKAPQPVRQAQYIPPPAPIAQAPAPMPAPVPVAPPPPAPKFERITLSATELFGFDSAELRAPQPKLDQLASALNSAGGSETLNIVGYTDRLGTPAYNLKLSQRRAEAVKSYLVGKGVTSSRLNAEGKGEANPVVECSNKKRADLIVCLEPNRRVEVEQIVIERRVN